jgi:hypothetical protein
MFFKMGWYPDGGMDNTDRLVQTNGTRSGTVIYPIAQPRSKVIPLGSDYIFYGSDTIEAWPSHLFTTYLFRLTPAAIPPGSGVGINETKNNKTISCYPNPASDKITISSNGFDLRDALLTIVDVTGKVVYSEKLGANNFSAVNIELPVSISDGFYLINIQNSSQSLSDRLVIHRN